MSRRRWFDGPDRGTRTAESATAHVSLHEAWRPKSPRRSETDHAAAGPLRRRSTAEPPPLAKNSSMAGPAGSLAHSTSAVAKGSATEAVTGRFLRELPAGADLREGGRGRKGPVGREVNGPEVLGMPGRCSHEKGTAEEGRNGDAPSSMRMGLLRRGRGRPYRGDPASRSLLVVDGDDISAKASERERESTCGGNGAWFYSDESAR
ncbi:hypothetical protein GW17_00009427 [Ensete ventricosum]|nr:hypothetical protein GW17_00009427 [Ensete ventricosum]